ncbi:MAG: hypothetical protein AW06_001461 [Candidatus Accumulibacter cognatus]|uniref:Uncharacterized protein n=1 Tax=Candidatus Accumulibacter cognatus TaxID=2954383 RepID=A0A080M877_9PROT|nr:MAG: hypothetical protein AW06_001461 [Candidatus Accumulibacter cognatus]
MYGAAVAVPISVVPWKNSTLLIVPSVSAAVAVRGIAAGATKLAPAAGAVRLTVGAWLPACTVTVRAALVVTPPALSVAWAVRR